MKLLQALRQQIAAEQTKVANLFAKQVGFNSIHDSSTVIEREHAKHAWKWLVQNKQLLKRLKTGQFKAHELAFMTHQELFPEKWKNLMLVYILSILAGLGLMLSQGQKDSVYPKPG